MTRHSARLALTVFGVSLAASSGASSPASAPPPPGHSRPQVPEVLRPYADKAPLVRVDLVGIMAMTDLDKMRPWIHLSVFDDGFVAYFVHPCGDHNGIRTRHLDQKQVTALANLSRRDCDALIGDPPRLQCTDSPPTRFACAGANGLRKVKMDCASGERWKSSTRFMANALDLAGLGGILAPIVQACRAAATDAVTVPENNPYDMDSYFPEPPSASAAPRKANP